MNVWVSAHAADRFAERVRPGLERKAASLELERLVREFGRVVDWPAWAHMDRSPKVGQFALELSDGVVVVCEPSSGRGQFVAVTVKIRGGSGEDHRHRGQDRRARRRARRVSRGMDRGSRPARPEPGWGEAA